jgi:hypothetical protein
MKPENAAGFQIGWTPRASQAMWLQRRPNRCSSFHQACWSAWRGHIEQVLADREEAGNLAEIDEVKSVEKREDTNHQ